MPITARSNQVIVSSLRIIQYLSAGFFVPSLLPIRDNLVEYISINGLLQTQ